MARRKDQRRKSGEGSGKSPAKQQHTPNPKPNPVKKTNAVLPRLKITLRDIRPPIWRRVQVKDCTLAELHEIIQVAMGWEFSHLYSFKVAGVELWRPRDDRRRGST